MSKGAAEEGDLEQEQRKIVGQSHVVEWPGILMRGWQMNLQGGHEGWVTGGVWAAMRQATAAAGDSKGGCQAAMPVCSCRSGAATGASILAAQLNSAQLSEPLLAQRPSCRSRCGRSR